MRNAIFFINLSLVSGIAISKRKICNTPFERKLRRKLIGEGY